MSSPLRMAVLSVILFFSNACSVIADSQNESIHYPNNTPFNNEFPLLDTTIERISHPIVITLNSNESSTKAELEKIRFDKSFLLENESSSKNDNSYHFPSTTQKIFNVIKVPENGPEWFSIIISIVALASSFGIPYIQHKNERKEAINEGYWVREVIMPKINGLAFDVVKTFKESISMPSDMFEDALSNSLLPKLGELRDSLYLFNSFKLLNDSIETLEEICDDLEERVFNHTEESREKRISDISTFHSTLINKLIEIHSKIG